jgi:RHS repeat-associated protein
VYYYHCNVAGLPEDVTDSEGRLIWRGRYSTWGRLLYEHTTSDTPRGFTQRLRMQGQYDDGDTGLYYNMFRYYDADAGRYLSPDPIGIEGGLNLYAYANSDPINWADPTGEWGIAGAVYGAIAGAVGGYISSGGDFWGTVAGAVAGVAIGAINPWGAHIAGAAGGAAASSVLGQVAGNIVSGNDILNPCNYDPFAIAGAAAGGALGGPANQFIGRVGPVIRPSVIGRSVSGSKIITVPSKVTGAAAEGAITGAGEAGGAAIGNRMRDMQEFLPSR